MPVSTSAAESFPRRLNSLKTACSLLESVSNIFGCAVRASAPYAKSLAVRGKPVKQWLAHVRSAIGTQPAQKVLAHVPGGNARHVTIGNVRLLLISKILFVIIYLVMLWFMRNGPLLKVCLLTFVVLFSVVGGFFGYYLLWPLPFAVVLRDKGVVPYSILAFLLNVGANPWVNLVFWVFCAGWSGLLVRGLLAERRSAVQLPPIL